MSWKDKDWDYLTFYNNDRITLEKAAADFLQCKKYSSAYLDGTKIRFTYKDGELEGYRYDTNIYPPNDYDKNMLQSIANYYNVCISYTWLSSYRIFDIKPTTADK